MNPLVRYLKLQQALDADVVAHLTRASQTIEKELQRLERASPRVGNLARTEQLRRAQAAIHREQAKMWGRIGNTVEAANAVAAAEGAESILAESDSLLGGLFSAEDRALMIRSVRQQAARGVEVLRERLSGSSRVGLAESVYGAQNLTSGKVDRIINDALARGASAAELAKDVRAYIDPTTRGGVRYAAMRLGRTELNNAFHASQVREAQREPWVTGVKWHLSGSHPVPDECNDYAESVHVDGGEAGVFDKSQVPAKPHPNCLCYTTPATVDEDEFIRRYNAGEYDDYLRQTMPQPGDLPGAPPAALPHRAEER